jgi:UDP-glucose 4-epimerase
MENSIVLVTGGLGYIGSHTVVELISAGFTPVIVDNLANSSMSRLSSLEELTGKSISFEEVDCTNEAEMRRVFSTYKINSVIHFAAFKSVEESQKIPEAYMRNNVGSTKVLLQLMNEFNLERFVFSSSCTVYGTPEVNPVSEKTPRLPAASVYGQTKQDCEDLIFAASKEAPFQSVVLRYFNPVGAHPSAKIGESTNDAPTNLIPLVCEVATGKREKLFVFGEDYDTPDGSCIRDYIHVVDLAKAHVLALNLSKETKLEIFNLGVGKGYSVKEVVDCFQKINGVSLKVEITGRRSGDVPAIWAVPDYAEMKMGWKCQLTIDDALAHAWNWTKNQVK